MQLLKADTQTKVLIGPAVAVGDGFTPVTTLALTTADEAEILKHDAAAVTSISANTFAAITSADGYYNLTITAAQLDTEGRLTVVINDDSLILPIRCDFMVVNANVFDSLYAASGTDVLDTNVAQWLGTAVATPTTAGVPEVDTTHVSGTAQTANDNGADINTLLTRIVGTIAAGTHNPASAAQIAVLSDLIDGGRIDLLIDAIKAVTDAQAATGTGLTAIPWNAAWDAEVQSEVNDALVANGLDHLVAASVTGTDVVNNSIVAKLVSSSATADWDDFVNTTDSMQAIRDRGDTAWTTATGFATETKQDATDIVIAELTTQGDTNETKIDALTANLSAVGVKKNAAFSNYEFLMVLTSDHVTPATGLTVTGQRSIDGGAFASVGGSIAEVSNGIYQFDALAADTNGDVITWRFSSATADDCFVTFKTVA